MLLSKPRTQRAKYVRPRKEIVIEEDKLNLKPVAILLSMFLLFLFSELLVLSVIGTKGTELSQVENEIAKEEEKIRSLESVISQSKALDRIELVAKSKLNMDKTTEVMYLESSDKISSL